MRSLARVTCGLFLLVALAHAGAETPRLRAMHAMQRGDFSEAIRAWRAHLAANPADDEGRSAYARSLAFAGRHTEALAEIRIVLSRHKEDLDLLALRARVLAWAGRRADAMADARRTIERVPRATQARLVLADVLTWEGRAAEALAHYRQALGERDDPDVRKRYVRALLAARSYADARAEAERLAQKLPADAEAKTLLEATREAGLTGVIEIAATSYEAGRVHPWWRLQLAGRVKVSASWELAGSAEHHWRDFQGRDSPPPPGVAGGYLRDTILQAEGVYRPAGRFSLLLQAAGAPQATFSPRTAFEVSPGYEVVKGVVLGTGYRGMLFDGQFAHLFMPTLSWYFGSHYLLARYYLAMLQTTGTSAATPTGSPSLTVGHSGMLRVGGLVARWLGWYAGVAGGLALVAAVLGPSTNPAVSAFGGLEWKPSLRDGIRTEYEYLNENAGAGSRAGVTWHAARLAYYRRF